MAKHVVKSALPLLLKGDSGKAVLIIHGFGGYAGEFYSLAREFHSRNFTVSLPRLPGHGTNREDYMSTGWRDWLNHGENSYLDLEADHDEVYLVGLSMGGLIALILASRYNPARVMALVPAMVASHPLVPLTPILRYVLPKTLPSGQKPEDETDGERKILCREYWSVNIPRQIAQLRKMQIIARNELHRITCPVRMIFSRTDESVDPRSEDVIKGGLKNCPSIRSEFLEKSQHVILTGERRKYVQDETVRWIVKGE